MTRKIYIGLLFIIGMSACSTVQLPPVDDAYHWPDKAPQIVSVTPNTSKYSESSESSESSKPSESSEIPVSPRMEYVNVQDTTITVRIRK